MKFLLLLVFLGLDTAWALAAQSNPTIYLSARTDGLPGTGTESNPINVSTTALFDAYFKARTQAHHLNAQSVDAVTFHFAAGNYTTTGLSTMSGWKLVGASQTSTTITVTGVNYSSNTVKYATMVQAVGSIWDSSNIHLKNLTIDGGTRATGTALAAAFTMPAPRQSVTVSVTDSSRMAAGRWYYVQDTAMTNGLQKWWGLVTCTAVSGKSVTLQNSEVTTSGSVTGDTTAGSAIVRNLSSTANLEESQPISGGSLPSGATIMSVDSSTQITVSSPAVRTSNQVPLSYQPCFTDNVSGPVLSTASLFPAGGRAGVYLDSSGIVVEHVTVQDISIPFYEGWAGIGVMNRALSQKVGAGNIIDHCTVRDMFGIYSGYISAISTNNYTGNNGTTEEVQITNNVIQGNGYYSGIEVAGVSATTISGNTVNNVSFGLFCDTGYNTGVTISGNAFTGAYGIHLGIGAPQNFDNTTIENNVITLTSNYGVGIGLTLNESNVTISNNTITLQTASNGAYGITLVNMSSGTTGNTATSNTIVSTLQNMGIDASQNHIVPLSQTKGQSNGSSSSTSSKSSGSATSSKSVPGGPQAIAKATTSAPATSGTDSDQAEALASQIDAETTQMAQVSSDSNASEADQEKQIVRQMDALARQMTSSGSAGKN